MLIQQDVGNITQTFESILTILSWAVVFKPRSAGMKGPKHIITPAAVAAA